MLSLVRALLWLLLACVVVGVAGRTHPVLGTMLDLARWPMIAIAFVCGGFAFARNAWRPAMMGLLVISALFADWLVVTLRVAREDDAAGASGKPLRVLTYNVGARGGAPDMTLEVIHGHAADVYAFQDVSPAWRGRLDREPALQGLHHEVRGRGEGGLGLWSRAPLRDVALVSEDRGADVALCGRIAWGGSEVALCNVRLSAPFWRPDTLELLEHWVVNARRREAQWALVDAYLRSTGVKHLLAAGDFSTMEWEPLYATARRSWLDAYRRASWGVGATWPALEKEPPLPLLRWDYAWTSPQFKAVSAEVIPLTGSRHRALWVTVQP